MDPTAFRWILGSIAIVLALAIYYFGQHQARLRKRDANESYTREEIDSNFSEDEQLRHELDGLNQILLDDGTDQNLEKIDIISAQEVQHAPVELPEIFIPAYLERKGADRQISYYLRHGDGRLVTGEEAAAAARDAGFELNDDGLLEFFEDGTLVFQMASLSQPGHFVGFDRLEFSTLGFNCFIDLDANLNPCLAYETMLKKIDELVRMLNLKVYKSRQELLTISDVTGTRQKLA